MLATKVFAVFFVILSIMNGFSDYSLHLSRKDGKVRVRRDFEDRRHVVALSITLGLVLAIIIFLENGSIVELRSADAKLLAILLTILAFLGVVALLILLLYILNMVASWATCGYLTEKADRINHADNEETGNNTAR